MEESVNCLIDLDSPVSNNPRASLMPPSNVCQKSNTSLCDFWVPSLLEENNPFDMVVRQTEINEADKNDPFEIAFETACGYQAETIDVPVISKDSIELPQINSDKITDVLLGKPTVVTSKKPVEVSLESEPLNESICKISGSLDEVNLENVQPPEFLVNSSFDLSDNDSININDTLNLSAMSDLKLGQTKLSPFMEECCKADDFLLGESAASLRRKPASSEVPERVLSPVDFHSQLLTKSENSGSFEESPIKALRELKSEESIKTLIENRIQKCIAKALNDSHQQFRHSILLDAGDTSFVSNQAKPPRASLRASLSVPQNLHLLHTEETCTKPEQSSDLNHLSPVKQNLLEELTIAMIDRKAETTRRSFNKSFDMITCSSAAQIDKEAQSTSTISDAKMSQYRKIVEAQLQQTEEELARLSVEVETKSKPKGHRRSLSCDVILPPQFPTKGSSPPILPPLPLSSETIRDLSLCSKYSPPKSKSPSNHPAKVSNRPAPMPTCAQPRLVLKKKPSTANKGPVIATASYGGPTKGPMKAVVPVKNMTRFTGSPRPPPQSQSRRASNTLSRQSSLGSPTLQKSKLCPLAASTPSIAPIVDKAGATNCPKIVRAPPEITVPPPRRISSGIPSPSRRSSSVSSGTASSSAQSNTPTRRTLVSAYSRNGNPRVLLDKNALTSPTMTPVRKSGIQTAVHTQPPKGHSQTSDKENVACQ